MENKMFYILMPIFLVILAFYPLIVPQYLSQGVFLIAWFVLLIIVSVSFKVYFIRKRK
ncbi:hypothetical protein ACEN4P_09080 [Marinilactibacillus psychrotolerans]|uniref:DUF3311 domain-containing protein n=1 Tax=Marinilactibacillus psychrotolerans TaxID=191770 RepID=A0ABW8UGB9_9LACT|nr:hypothetical protein [Marinilactibacillus psychrotolerans]GEQ33710.1 hypothetical protein B795N_15920 [Marinilactibacillus psychrotolerans]